MQISVRFEVNCNQLEYQRVRFNELSAIGLRCNKATHTGSMLNKQFDTGKVHRAFVLKPAHI